MHFSKTISVIEMTSRMSKKPTNEFDLRSSSGADRILFLTRLWNAVVNESAVVKKTGVGDLISLTVCAFKSASICLLLF